MKNNQVESLKEFRYSSVHSQRGFSSVAGLWNTDYMHNPMDQGVEQEAQRNI